MDLSLLRKEIDEIDDELIPLLIRRMEVCERVAEYKLKNGISVLNKGREQEILNKAGEKSGEYSDEIKAIFTAIMDSSKKLQNKKMQ